MKPLDNIGPMDISSIQPVERSSPPSVQPKTVETEGTSRNMGLASEKGSEKATLKTDKTERDREIQKEMVQKMVDRLNRMSRVLDRKIQFEVGEETEDVIVKIIDRETGHTIRQIPPPELVKLTTRMEEIHEIIFNLKL